MNIPKINFLTKEPKKPRMRNTGYYRAMQIGALTATPLSIIAGGAFAGMKRVSQVSKEEFISLRRSAQEGLKNSGLFDKGVRIYSIQEKPVLTKKFIKESLKNIYKLINPETRDVAAENLASMGNKILDYSKKDEKALEAIKDGMKIAAERRLKRLHLDKNPKGAEESLANAMNEMISNIFARTQAMPYREGKNAAFFFDANKIIMPSKSLQTSVFHEMGHALNANGGKILKTLQRVRPIALGTAGVVLMISLLNKRKTTDEKLENNSVKNILQNGVDFIKRNAGKITVLSTLPVVLEEGIASLRGQGIAKQLVKDGKLSQALYKKIVATNAFGFSTYVIAAVIAGVTAKAAVKAKDKIQTEYENKKIAKYQEKFAKYVNKNLQRN